MADRFVVVWRVTEACNLSCGFCKYDRRLDFPRRSADPEHVLALGAELARWQRDRGVPVHVSFLGGEPLLWPPLQSVARAFRERFGLGTGVTSNGTALCPDPRHALLQHLDELTLSVDGVGEIHDRLRGWPGGWARLARTLHAIAAERRPLLRANTVLMRDNVAGFAALCRELASLGVREITFNQLGGNDRPEFFAVQRLLPEQVATLGAELSALERELADRGVRLCGGERYLERIHASARGRRLPIADCAPGERFLFLDEDGVASPCSFTTEALGRPLARAGLSRLPALFRAGARPASCSDCPSTQVFGKFADPTTMRGS